MPAERFAWKDEHVNTFLSKFAAKYKFSQTETDMLIKAFLKEPLNLFKMDERNLKLLIGNARIAQLLYKEVGGTSGLRFWLLATFLLAATCLMAAIPTKMIMEKPTPPPLAEEELPFDITSIFSDSQSPSIDPKDKL